MALLLKKKRIINSLGEEQELNIYTTKSEAVDGGMPYKVVKVNVDGEIITGYIGCTNDLSAKKASSKKISFNGIEYRERKYMGVKTMNYYMKNNYPDNYNSLTEITESMIIDSSDCIDFANFYRDCQYVKIFPKIDTRNGNTFASMYYNCKQGLQFPDVNTSNANYLGYMYYNCTSATELPDLDTSKCINFLFMYANCVKCEKVSPIDFSMATDSELKGLNNIVNMFTGCSSLKTITFNNLPIGTTESTLRTKCYIPDTVTEIIMNFREV